MSNRFSAAQLRKLEDQYRRNRYPMPEEKMKLCKDTNLSDLQIQDWFTNHRKRSKKAATGTVHFTGKQTSSLLKMFRINPYPTREEKQRLSSQFNVPIRAIESWFREAQRERDTSGTHALSAEEVNRLDNWLVLDPRPKKKDIMSIAVEMSVDYEAVEAYALSRKRGKSTEPEHPTTPKTLPIAIKTLMTEQYERNPYPSTEEKRELMKKAGIPLSQLEIWFSERRRRRDTKRIEQDMAPNVGDTAADSELDLSEGLLGEPMDAGSNGVSPGSVQVAVDAELGSNKRIILDVSDLVVDGNSAESGSADPESLSDEEASAASGLLGLTGSASVSHDFH